jgi:alpha-L-rhamnosidase
MGTAKQYDEHYDRLPHREKQGWLEECHLNGPALRYNFDMAPLFRKVMNDMNDSQLSSGLVPNIAPEFFHASADPNNAFRNSPEWGSSFIIIPWQQYLFSGDISLMRTYFPNMKRYVAFLESTAKTIYCKQALAIGTILGLNRLGALN